MAQILVRNIEDSVKEQIRRQAKRNGRSLEDEVRHILRDAGKKKVSNKGLGTQIADLFRGRGLDFEIQEFHGEPVRPARFDD